MRAAENLIAKIEGVELMGSHCTFELAALKGQEKLSKKCTILVSQAE
jgi:hypothetical protein